MADNLKLKAMQEAQAKPSASLSTSAGGQTAALRIVG